MYISSCSIRSWNWNRKLTQDHLLIEHWIQRTQRCPAARCWPWVYSLVLVSRYSTVRSETLTWREWGLWSWHWKYSDDGQSMVLSPRGASSITRGHKGTMAGRTVASQRIKQWSDGLCTDCDQFSTHFCPIVLKVVILMVISSTTTLFSFLLVDICFLSDSVMHPWSKVIITHYVYKKTRKYISSIFFLQLGLH